MCSVTVLTVDQHTFLQILFLVLYVHVVGCPSAVLFKTKSFRNIGVNDWTKCQTVGWTPLKYKVRVIEICSVLEKSKGYTEVVTCFLIEHIKGKVKWTVISCNSAKI